MPRAPTLLQSEYPYNIGGRCVNREWFGLPLETVWEIMSEQLYYLHHAYDVKIHSFVLMSNHFHLMLTTPKANLSEAMQRFMRESARNISKPAARINYVFGGPYFRTMIRSNHHFLHAYKYNYANPVKAKVCARAEDYPFSTLHGLLGRSRLIIPIEEDQTLFSNLEGTLEWINLEPPEEDWQAVRKALRRREFTLGKVDKAAHPLEINAL